MLARSAISRFTAINSKFENLVQTEMLAVDSFDQYHLSSCHFG